MPNVWSALETLSSIPLEVEMFVFLLLSS